MSWLLDNNFTQQLEKWKKWFYIYHLMESQRDMNSDFNELIANDPNYNGLW